MPNYKFFEVKRDESSVQRKLEFNEFDLKTRDRSLKKQESMKSTNTQGETEVSVSFKARKMPNFATQNQLNGIDLQSPKKLTKFAPFKLTTVDRGNEKNRKLEDLKEKEE